MNRAVYVYREAAYVLSTSSRPLTRIALLSVAIPGPDEKHSREGWLSETSVLLSTGKAQQCGRQLFCQ